MSASIQIVIPIPNVIYIGNLVADYLFTCDLKQDIDDSILARRCRELYGLPNISDDEAIRYGMDRSINQMYYNTRTKSFIPLNEPTSAPGIMHYTDIDLMYLDSLYMYFGKSEDDEFTKHAKAQIQKIWDQPYVISHTFQNGTQLRTIVAIQAEYEDTVCYAQGWFFHDDFLNYQELYIGIDLKEVKEQLKKIILVDDSLGKKMYEYFINAFTFYTEQGSHPILKIVF